MKRRRVFIGIVLIGLMVIILAFGFRPSRRTGELNEARDGHTAVLLQDGRVLVMGGGVHVSGTTFHNQIVEQLQNRSPWLLAQLGLSEEWDFERIVSCEIFDPKTESWTKTASLDGTRVSGTALLLSDGRVFLQGGSSDVDDEVPIDQPPAEIFDPKTQKWTTCPMKGEKQRSLLFRLSESQILKIQDESIYKGDPSEGWIYDLKSRNWSRHPEYDGSLDLFEFPGAFVLPSGKLMVEGNSTDLYDPKVRKWAEVDQPDLPDSVNAVALKDGRVLRVGGMDGLNIVNKAYIF